MGSGSSLPREAEPRAVNAEDLYRRHGSDRVARNVDEMTMNVDENISALVLSDILKVINAKTEGFDGANAVIEAASKTIESRLNAMRPRSYVQCFAVSRSAIYAHKSLTSGSVPTAMYKPKKSAIINALNAAGKDMFATLEVAAEDTDPGLDFNFGLKKCHVMATIIPSSAEYDTDGCDTEGVEIILWDTLVAVYNPDGSFTETEQGYLKLMATMIEHPWNAFTSRVTAEEDHKNQVKLEKMTEHLNSSMVVSTVVLMILDEAKKFIDAEVCSMFLVDHTTQELVAFVFDSKTSDTEPISLPIDDKTPVEAHQVEDVDSGCEVRFPMSAGIAGYVATNNVTLNISDVYEDERFDQNFDKMTGFKTRNMLAVPIIDQGKVIGVAEMINKNKNLPFTKRDERTFKNFIAHTATTLRHAQLYTESKRGVKQRESMLTVAKTIFTETKMKTLIYEIVLQAHQLIKCERCSCFLVDDVRGDLRSLVFDMGKRDVEHILKKGRKTEAFNTKRRIGTSTAFSMFREGAMSSGDLSSDMDVDDEDAYDYQIRIPKDHGIIGHVATTGQPVNIGDAYADPRFNNEMDKATGFKTRNLLVIAIPDNDGKVIGVVSLINKVGSRFDSGDERNLASFAIFCGVGIQSNRLHSRMAKEQKRTRIALEMIAYRTRAPHSAVEEVLAYPVPEDEWEMNTLNFAAYKLDDINKHRCIMQMFDNFGLIEHFKLDRESLIRFVISVGKNYRDVPFHNWDHAVAVLHGCYMVLKTINAEVETIDKMDQLALMISCMCHDVDHRGTNNAFLADTESELQSVYGGSSVLEKHHFHHSMSILHNPDNYFLHTMSENDQQLVQELIQENITATDLSIHSKQVRPKFKTLTRDELVHTPIGKHMLRSVLMTSSDLSDTFRSWEVQQESAKRVYDEFFRQGDKEKSLGKEPIDMMNADKENIPKQQIGYFDYIVFPLYHAAVAKFPEMQVFLDRVESNRENWRKAGEARNKATHYEQGEKVVLPSL